MASRQRSLSGRNLIAIGRVAASIGTCALITVLYFQLLRVNPTTVALSYLMAILLIASTWGIVEATAASIFAVPCFNFFFLPPVGTFTRLFSGPLRQTKLSEVIAKLRFCLTSP